MKLARTLALGALLSGLVFTAGTAEARHRHDRHCDHGPRYSHRHDRGHYDRDYYRGGYYGGGYYDGRRYDGRYYGHRHSRPYRHYRGHHHYRPAYHYHGGHRCSRSHVSIHFGF
jgi:hypothetical protein